MGFYRLPRTSMPLQVAAVCYRRRGTSIEFLLVNTNGGKWTFPKGRAEPHLSHSEAARSEAVEEAGAIGLIEPNHFQEYVVKAFLLEVERVVTPHESGRNPTWFTPTEAKRALKGGREVKYANELQLVIDVALEKIRTGKIRVLAE
jgi:8-oxo-dGTP pyrophosphatase MutT (NUDIX family)